MTELDPRSFMAGAILTVIMSKGGLGTDELNAKFVDDRLRKIGFDGVTPEEVDKTLDLTSDMMEKALRA